MFAKMKTAAAAALPVALVLSAPVQAQVSETDFATIEAAIATSTAQAGTIALGVLLLVLGIVAVRWVMRAFNGGK